MRARIVIVEGKDPRQTISIVEVQKRNSKTDINTFDGWLQKMKDVGAQHLFCVSEKGFPGSIKEKAEVIGPTVRLLTLKQIEEENWPISYASFSGNFRIVRYNQLKGMEFDYIHLIPCEDKYHKLPDPYEKIFSNSRRT